MSGRDLLDAVVRVARRHRPPPPPAPLQRVTRPSVEHFADLRRASRPVLLDGVVDEWPSRAHWTLACLRERFRDRLISATPTRSGGLTYDLRTGIAFETIGLGEYIDRLERGDWPEAYLNAPWDTWLPELNDNVQPPAYCRDASWRSARFWLSAPGMSSPLHRHGTENLFFQLVGRKRFLLYAPAATPWLYSNPLHSALRNWSRFDPEKPDDQRFPLGGAVQPREVILGPGDAIYLPAGWWHYVRSLEVSLSVNFFFADGALAVAVRAAEFVKRVRGVEIYTLAQHRRARGKVAASSKTRRTFRARLFA